MENSVKKIIKGPGENFTDDNDCSFVVDADSIFITTSPAFQKLLGYTEEELKGKSFMDIIHRTEEMQKFTSPYIFYHFHRANQLPVKMELVDKRGNAVPVLFRSKLKRDDGNRIVGATGTVEDLRDIEKKKRLDQLNILVEEKTHELSIANEQLSQSKEFLENIFKTTADGIIITDTNGHIAKVNKAIEKMLGYSENELIGKKNTELGIQDEKDLKVGRYILDQLKKNAFVENCETRWRRKDGSSVSVELNVTVLKDSDGKLVGDVAAIRDISERKKMEEQLLQSAKLKSLGKLSAGVAHDFNNILAAILGRAQLLSKKIEQVAGKKGKATDDFKKGLGVIEKAALDGSETVRRIQEFSRRGGDDQYFEKVDIKEIIEDALEFTRARWKTEAESKGIEIKIEKRFSSVPMVEGNTSELREVMVNMVNNAVEAMPQGGTISIKTFKKKNNVIVAVQDKGMGMPEGTRERVFDPFFTTKGPQTTGLGMSISYGVINRHHGTISVKSIEGKGSTFIISLPVADKGKAGKAKESETGTTKKATILVIDDDEAVREVFQEILAEDGHEIVVASNGKEGIAAFKKKKIDLVFTDLGMPGISGWKVAEEIKKTNGKIPVILLTGWQVKLEENELKNKGIDLVMNKPVQMKQLLSLVAEGMKLKACLENS